MSDKKSPFKIPLNDVVNIFQLANMEVLTQPEKDEDLTQMFQDLYGIVEYFKSPSTSILESPSLISFSLSHKKSDKGGEIFFNHIKIGGENAEIEEWFFIAITQQADIAKGVKKTDIKPQPLFLLVGTIEDEKNFVPRDSTASFLADDGEISMAIPNTDDEFCALMLYADCAFRAIMTEQDMKIDNFASCLTPEQIETAKDEYYKIKDRTATDLSVYIEKCDKAKNPYYTAPSAPMLPPPPMLQ